MSLFTTRKAAAAQDDTRDRDLTGLELDGADDPELLLPGIRLPFSRTPEERQLEKEARQQRRLDKRNERRARQGLPPN